MSTLISFILLGLLFLYHAFHFNFQPLSAKFGNSNPGSGSAAFDGYEYDDE